MRKLLLLFLSVITTTILFAQKDSLKNNSGLVYGPNHSYFLTAPSGWVLDNESGLQEGLMAVFYPKGETWADAETVMYTTFSSYDTTKKEDVYVMIKYDSVQFTTNAPKIKIIKQKPIKMGKTKKTALIYDYLDEENKNFERVAYIGENKGVAMIIITSRSNAGLQKNIKKFESLLKTYRFLTDNVSLPK